MAVGAPRRKRHGGDIGACFGLAERECGNCFARRDVRQIARFQFVRAGERDRAAAEALHGEGEIGKPGVARKRLARDHEIKRAQLIVRAAMAFGDAIAKPAALPERAHPSLAERVDIAMAAVALDIGGRLTCPLIEPLGKGPMLGIEKRQPQMPGPAHGSPLK